MDTQSSELHLLEATSVELTQARDDLNQQFKLKCQELDQLQQQLSKQAEQHTELQVLHGQTEAQRVELQRELDSAHQQQSKQSSDLHTLQSQAAELTRAKAELQQQLSEHVEQTSQLQSAYSQEVTCCEELQKQLASQCAAADDLKSQITVQDEELRSQRLAYSGKHCHKMPTATAAVVPSAGCPDVLVHSSIAPLLNALQLLLHALCAQTWYAARHVSATSSCAAGTTLFVCTHYCDLHLSIATAAVTDMWPLIVQIWRLSKPPLSTRPLHRLLPSQLLKRTRPLSPSLCSSCNSSCTPLSKS